MSDEKQDSATGFEIAVIGMAGRFPGAKNIAEYWENLKNGVESIYFFTNKELEDGGVESDDLDEPNYKKTKGTLEDLEYFDPVFFGYTNMEAEKMSPQIRILHECTWNALEDAGYEPGAYDKLIGLYAGATNNLLWQSVITSSGAGSSSESYNTMQLCDKDHISTRISYKLNLNGPSFTVETQCSTSLVAVHLAVQGLLGGECDMALAGGVSITLPKKCGYKYQEGMVESLDGHVRTFDARASGTIFGNGVGLVVLKRLNEAIADRDHIYAVIKGSAINNDGNRKVGYMAPSVEGQMEVIRAAQQMAEVDPETIDYIEAHGTGTVLGDPIEIEALTQAFNTSKKGYCRIGSVKSNIGHLADAAGVSGLIKTILAMKHKLIPPSLHFENPNPKIEFENTPFIVNSKLTAWKNENHPLRAGVSSFGIGGTNAHMVLEQAPLIGHSSLVIGEKRKEREYQLILLSARTKSALDRATQNLANHFKKNPGIKLADAAYTLQVGRKAFKNRRALLGSSINEAVAALEKSHREKVHSFRAAEGETPVIFMFSGQGSQYVNMGLDIYQAEPSFRADVDRCLDILKDIFGHDLKHILYPGEPVSNKNKEEIPSQGNPGTGEVKNQIDEMIYSGPIKFILDYSLAKLLIKWGIQPSAMIGHSFGEYVAACLSGVFSLEDALKLVVLRGRLIEETARGAMMSVPLSEEELKPLLNDEVSLAAVNTPTLCIVSGVPRAVGAFEKELNEKGYECVRLNLSHAGHSKTMDPVLEEFKDYISGLQRNKPRVPYISNVTGKWITAEEAVDPGYYTAHMRRTVRFADGITILLEKPNAAFVQVGPGRGLALFVEQHPGKTPQNQVINLLRHPKEDISDNYFLLSNIGQLWISGVNVDWEEFHANENRRRMSLPPYSFDRQRYWKYPTDFLNQISGKTLKKQKDISKWFYVSAWKPSPWRRPQPGEFQTRLCWLVFMDENGLGETLAKWLEQQNQEIIRVNYDPDAGFSKTNDRTFTLNPRQDENYDMLFDELGKLKQNPAKIIHLWTLTKDEKEENVLEPAWVDKIQDLGFHSLINLAKSIGKQGFENRLTIGVITNHMRQLYDEGFISPGKATITGPVITIPTEYPDIDCFAVDIALPEPGTREENKLVERLLAEFTSESPDHSIAYRGNKRLLETTASVKLKKSKQSMTRLREEGVYLVIGGLGGVGLVTAEFLAKTVRARLILVGRSAFPAREEWEEWHAAHDKEDETSSKIGKIKELEEMGARVLVFSADVSNQEQVQQVVHRSEEQFGPINGIIHSAVVLDGAVIPRRTRQMTEKIFAPKITGTLVLDKIARGKEMDFFVLYSSVAAYLRTLGEVGYCAANAFQDAYAHYKNIRDGVFTLSINWDTWQEVGGAVRTAERVSKAFNISDAEAVTKHGILPKQGIEAFKRVMQEDLHQVVVSTRDFDMLLKRLYSKEDKKKNKDEVITFPEEIEEMPGKDTLYKRPELSTEYVEPASEIEKVLAQVWQSFFGIDKVGTKDDFFELGGDSLKAMIVVSMIHKKLNVRVPVSKLFAGSTIKALAQYISSDKDGDKKQNKYLAIKPVEEKEYYPASSAQKRMLILNRMKKSHDTSDNTPEVMISEGEMDVQRFEEAAKKLVQRHESFRTSFHLKDDGAIQRVHKNIDLKVDHIDVGTANPGDNDQFNSDENKTNRISTKFIHPFDLSKAPLFRIGLAKLTENKHLVLYDMHHIIRDGASTQIFTVEFIDLYYGQQLPGIRIRYKDFSTWQNKFLQSGVIKRQEEYWLNRFSGSLPELNMPTDYPRPPIHSFEGDFINFFLDTHLVKKVKKMVLETGATLYMVLLAVYNLLLSRYTGQEDIIVGTPIAGRPNVELKSIVGMFVNTLAMRNFPKGEMTFKEFLEEVKTNSLKAYENQDYQFEDLVDRLNIKRDQSRHVLFDTMFDTQNFDIKKPEEQEKSNEEIKELNFTRVIFEEKITQFDIILHAYESSDIINFKLRYSTHLFKRESMEMFVDNFKKILTQVVDNAEMKLNDIKISHHLEATESNIPDVDFKF